ncbi:MAG: smalltalk protein [Bacteroidaceae bacterium]|nr:smalltalk protein [Bacteroidaceae bacterium]
MRKDTWKFVIQTILAVLTAIATSFGVTSCMN